MFKIYDGRQNFYQWDVDRKLIIEDKTITEVHFCNKTGKCSLVCETYEENGQKVVNVPNILLQTDWRINVYAYNVNYTKYSETFNVVARTKPDSYVYTETEVLNYETLSAQMDEVVGMATNAEEKAETAEEKAETAEAIAKGKATGYVFDTLEDLELWLEDAANVSKLNLGDNLYIKALKVPDYWWDGTTKQQLETQKVDLTEYIKDTDYGTSTKAGIIKASSANGFYINKEGLLSIVQATEAGIDGRTDKFKPITPANLDYAVKSVVGGHITLTQAEYDALETKDENTYYYIVEE